MAYALNSFHDRRRDIRFPTSFRAALQWGDRTIIVEAVDIANHGLRFQGGDLPSMGTVVQVGAHGLDERGYVIWREAQACGVHLARRISALAVVRANCFPVKPARTDHVLDDLPPWLDDAMLAGIQLRAARSNRASWRGTV